MIFSLAEARFILSHVYCVLCLPQSDGWVYQWGRGFGEPRCCRCTCNQPADLRPGPFTHDEACIVLTKMCPQPWRRDMVEEIV